MMLRPRGVEYWGRFARFVFCLAVFPNFVNKKIIVPQSVALNRSRRIPSFIERVTFGLGSIILYLIIAAQVAYAGTFTAFGPQAFYRGSGKPVPVQSAFAVLDPAAQYTLIVHNGGLEASAEQGERVSSGLIYLNGGLVVGPNRFNQKVTRIEEPVTLSAQNELVVEVRGKPGGVITIEIIGVDDELPIIIASADPAPNTAGWNNSAVTVSFDCSDNTSGIASCSDPVTVQTEGAGQIVEGTAVDNAGNSASASVTLNVDLTPPALQIVSPLDGETVDTTPTLLDVTYSDSVSGINTNGFVAAIDSTDVTSAFAVTQTGSTYSANLPDGVHSIDASILDIAGNSASALSTFTVTTNTAVFRSIADCAPTTGNVPLTVRFRSRGEFSGGSIVRYRWDFEGDGSFDTSDSVARDYTRTFSTSGTRNAVLEVTNNLGETATDTCIIDVTGNAPTASANASPSNGEIPLDVAFSCVGTDPDGTIVLYEWDFDGDGTFDFSSPSSGAASNTYTTEGTFVAVCRVTDNDGQTGDARATTTTIRSGPPGSPSVEATASPSNGNAPLTVSFGGTATDDGSIVLWEWDFDGDGTFDFSSPTSPATSFIYADGGIFAAALRVTDDEGLAGTDIIEIVVNLTASLSIPDDTFDPSSGESVVVNTSLTAGVPVRVLIKDESGKVVRTLVDEVRAAGSYSDVWDGSDNVGQPLPQGQYFAVLEYEFGGDIRTVDLTNTTGGTRYNPSRNRLPSTFSPYEDDLLTINFTIPESRGASEIQAFIGTFYVDTRFITLLERVPFGVGTHTIHWDGLDPGGNFAVPPPGDYFLFGIWGYTLADNAIVIQSAPVISNVVIDPNFFDPSTPDFISPSSPIANVTYDLDKLADVELSVTNLSTGIVLRRVTDFSVAPGIGNSIGWDGLTDDGLFADRGDYRIALQATDSTGSKSIIRYGLIRVFY